MTTADLRERNLIPFEAVERRRLLHVQPAVSPDTDQRRSCWCHLVWLTTPQVANETNDEVLFFYELRRFVELLLKPTTPRCWNCQHAG
jgi:hypothetical protein